MNGIVYKLRVKGDVCESIDLLLKNYKTLKHTSPCLPQAALKGEWGGERGRKKQTQKETDRHTHTHAMPVSSALWEVKTIIKKEKEDVKIHLPAFLWCTSI